MAPEPLVERVHRYLGPLILRRALSAKCFQPSSMGEEVVQLDSDEFKILVNRDRGGNEWIEVGSKIRPKPRAPLRSYLLCRLIAFLYGSAPKDRCDLEAEARLLVEREKELLNSVLINSEELRLWNTDAARVMFGQKPHGNWPR